MANRSLFIQKFLKIKKEKSFTVLNKSGIEGFIHYDHFIHYSTDRPIPKELKVDNTNYLSKKELLPWKLRP